MHKALGQEATALASYPVKLSLRALSYTLIELPHQRKPISPEMLQVLCDLACQQGNLVIKCAILLAFFGLLRCSSLAPASTAHFSPHKNVCRGDIILEEPGLHIILRHSKTRQQSSYCHVLPVPQLPGHPLCPVQAYKDMVAGQPGPANSPLLQCPDSAPVTCPQLRAMLKLLLQSAGLSTKHYTFHGLRRGGASFAYQLGQDLSAIKHHGDWKSDAVRLYIESQFRDPALPLAMASAITSGQF